MRPTSWMRDLQNSMSRCPPSRYQASVTVRMSDPGERQIALTQRHSPLEIARGECDLGESDAGSIV
jgi:hypothetical protein